jgi:hypothetical protein
MAARGMLYKPTALAYWMLFRLWCTGQFDDERRYMRSNSGLRYIQGPFALASETSAFNCFSRLP